MGNANSWVSFPAQSMESGQAPYHTSNEVLRSLLYSSSSKCINMKFLCHVLLLCACFFPLNKLLDTILFDVFSLNNVAIFTKYNYLLTVYSY